MSGKETEKFTNEAMTLVAWVYRQANTEHFRLCADFMHFFWVIDDITDHQSSVENQHVAANMECILADPSEMPCDDGVLEKMCRSFWTNILDQLNSLTATKDRFVSHLMSYMEAVQEKTKDRETGRLRSRSEHFDLRRRTGGVRPSFDFIYMPFHLSEHVVNHEVIERMAVTTGDLVVIANDVYSYNVEQAGGQKRVAHNIVDVVLRERGRGVQDAMDVVGKMYRDLSISLLNDYNNLPQFDKIGQNEVIQEYALGLLDWVEANVEYSLNSQRYFGKEAGSQKVRISRMVKLLPKKGQ
ncbi:hypothetical protein yc1106_06306 [Curvularia clavata]|uniref:Terpene synthase n=1 Tax=Curvularia clavata TaxID=95742 RepID=A0A9Q8Z9M2_CURCL|nr:hypothetical protein yc1106_06306 [Curvularia clavata]